MLNFIDTLQLINILMRLLLIAHFLHKYPKNRKAYVKHLFIAALIVVEFTSVFELIYKVLSRHFELIDAVEINILLFLHFISDALDVNLTL